MAPVLLQYVVSMCLVFALLTLIAFQTNFGSPWSYPQPRSFETVTLKIAKEQDNGLTPSLLTTQAPWNSKTGLLTTRKCDARYTLLILITSAPGGADRRTTIRQTWGRSWHNRGDLPTWKTFFLCGQAADKETQDKVLAEDAEHQDMIIGNFTDIFYHLGQKIIMSFEWANQYCSGYDYLMKSDDDVFFSVPNFCKYARTNNLTKSGLYGGNLLSNSWPFRAGKYAVTEQEYPNKKYPPFMSGGGMFFSEDVAQKMIDAHDPNNYFKLDDVYIGMLAEKLQVRTTFIKGLSLFHDPRTCRCSPDEITHHKVDNLKCMQTLYECGKTH